MQDLIDIGFGYDETDPFIDNSEAVSAAHFINNEILHLFFSLFCRCPFYFVRCPPLVFTIMLPIVLFSPLLSGH